MVRVISNVIKVPRADPLQDIPAYFPPLKNLHLELMEDKDKLKPGLPLIAPDTASEKIIFYSVDDAGKFDRRSANDTARSHQPPKSRESIPDDAHHSEDEPVPLDFVETDDGSASPDAVDDDEKEFLDELGDDVDIEEDDVQEVDTASIEEEEDDPYAGLTPEERERMEKDEYIWRFRIMKKANPKYDIPVFNRHSDLQMMKNVYSTKLKEITFDNRVSKYRKILTGSFMAIEYAAIQFVGIDMKGFALQQSKDMDSYNSMLVELGERQYGGMGSNLPVELKLVGLVLFQAGMFYLGKIIVDKYGGSAADLFSGFVNSSNDTAIFQEVREDEPQNASSSRGTGKRMRGPKIKADELD